VCIFVSIFLCVSICSEGGLSPVAQTDSNGGSTINEILHETAKYAFHSAASIVLYCILLQYRIVLLLYVYCCRLVYSVNACMYSCFY